MGDIVPMTADELFTKAKLGSLVRYYDDEPLPARHHKQKMREWKTNNGMGFLVQLKPGSETHPNDRPTFTIQERIGIDHIYDLDSTLMFEVRPPIPGTILAYTEQDGVKTVERIWFGQYEARKWARMNDRDLDRCGYKYLAVTKSGALIPYRIPKVALVRFDLTEVLSACT